jgi:hypothetical protein
MKMYFPFFLLLISCNHYALAPDLRTNEAIVTSNFNSETASHLTSVIQKPTFIDWKFDITRIRNAYARVVCVLEDKEAIQFSSVFLKALTKSEELDMQALCLSDSRENLPNTEALKFYYKAERELDAVIASLAAFTQSSNQEIKECASEAERYFNCQKDLYISIRSVDYRLLKQGNVPHDVLQVNAKMLQQRESLCECLVSYYDRFS